MTQAHDFSDIESALDSSDSFDDLEDLLSTAKAEQAEVAAVKSARKRKLDGRLSGEESAEIEATIKRWEMAKEWLPVANVAMFEAQVCQCCGASSLHFRGFFQRQQGRQTKADRWVAVDSDKQAPNLPKERKIMETPALTCASCASLSGYPL